MAKVRRLHGKARGDRVGVWGLGYSSSDRWSGWSQAHHGLRQSGDRDSHCEQRASERLVRERGVVQRCRAVVI